MIYGSYRVLAVCGAGGVLRALAVNLVTGQREYVNVDVDNGQVRKV